MNVALAYLNCSGRLARRAPAAQPGGGRGTLSGAYARVKADYPQRCGFIEERLAELADIESRGETDPTPARAASGG